MSQNKKSATYNMVLVALFSSFLVICSLIHISTSIPITLQTFGIFLALAILGGKLGTLTIFLYIFLGIIGLPVFSNFSGGVGHIFGASGGYIIGFIFIGIIVWLFEILFGKSNYIFIISSVVGLLICYLFGSIWYTYIYFNAINIKNLISVLSVSVLPFILPDLIKLFLALVIKRKIIKHISW